jgi:hypothetical protein
MVLSLAAVPLLVLLKPPARRRAQVVSPSAPAPEAAPAPAAGP